MLIIRHIAAPSLLERVELGNDGVKASSAIAASGLGHTIAISAHITMCAYRLPRGTLLDPIRLRLR